MVQYRHVFNDAVVGPWENLPAIDPPTLQGLYSYLEKCPGWSGKSIEVGRSRNSHIVDYGLRAQFKFDEEVSEEDHLWLKREVLKLKLTVYFISGHLDTTVDEFIEHYKPAMERAMGKGCSFVVGDARGTDTLAQEFLKGYPDVTIYHMFDSPRNNSGNHPTAGGYKSDEERDAAMTFASTYDIAWVRPGREKSGTANNIKGDPMNDTLKDFARKQILEGLENLPEGWQNRFKLMYGRLGGKRSVEDATALSLKDVVEEIPEGKLDWAMQQVERSIELLSKEAAE